MAIRSGRKQMIKIFSLYLTSRRLGTACGSSLAVLAPTVAMSETNISVSKNWPKTVKDKQVADARTISSVQRRFRWLHEHAPCFGVNGDNISVINEPVDFYESFKAMVTGARRRIVIASLYLGTSTLEEELVKAIDQACQRAAECDGGGSEKLEVHILLDYNRGSRGIKSSRTMLLPLLEKYGASVQVYLYHTPDLRGLLKYYLSERFNEVVGLNHMKIYMADDDIIISGANLSDSYFTNRQDRYMQFRNCPQMADYFLRLVQAVSKFSFHLQPDDSVKYPQNAPHPHEGSSSPEDFKNFANDIMQNMMRAEMLASKLELDISAGDRTHEESPTDSEIDTWLFPLIQMGPFGIGDDEKVTQLLFKKSEESDRLCLASGYFNLTDEYTSAILNESRGKFDILTASPEANGFLGSKGLSGYVPAVYTNIARRFYSQMCALCQEQRISLHEYYRQHWTFHCKGLWYYVPELQLPVLTLIGSPNFGYRSVYRDLECQLVVMTTNPSLQQQLQEEQEGLFARALPVTEKTFQQPDRHVPLWVRLITKVVQNFF